MLNTVITTRDRAQGTSDYILTTTDQHNSNMINHNLPYSMSNIPLEVNDLIIAPHPDITTPPSSQDLGLLPPTHSTYQEIAALHPQLSSDDPSAPLILTSDRALCPTPFSISDSAMRIAESGGT
jgi:hypothetical protein